jgi:hypothetical protein
MSLYTKMKNVLTIIIDSFSSIKLCLKLKLKIYSESSGGLKGSAGCDRPHSEKNLSVFSSGKGLKMGRYYL